MNLVPGHTADELLEQAARCRRLARYVFDREVAEYIQRRAVEIEAQARSKTFDEDEHATKNFSAFQATPTLPTK